ncbi:hypothetical protein DENIS_0739 [Desulfonema ishimotonii]|uniref:DUF1722 domain-containing protein n=2 Tax=Desulfonema ishimotonii TaxID=45657 RepID=A0A401FS61_9BACT|nr:hypothetical protein DENIS_0739 [Desulfonema ishimotonii]
MRIWDIHPGYLNRQSLLGEHRELHGMASIILHNKKGYSRHPETLRWKPHLSGLIMRHEFLVAEMALRGYNHRSPLDRETGAVSWPEIFIDPPGGQFRILKEKYKDREEGRIPLPGSAQALWAHHKYSVLARDPEYYRRIGPALSGPAPRLSFDRLAEMLVRLMRQPPPRGRLINALMHMWGYVSDMENRETGKKLPDHPADALHRIRQLALENHADYLVRSTALSDLSVWTAAAV